jgi:hypothetical protein
VKTPTDLKRSLLLFVAPLCLHAAAPTADWAPNLDASMDWINNASNGEAVWDRVDALRFRADSLSSGKYDLGRSDAAHLSIHLAGDWFPRFLKLDSAAAGARVDWQHTFGADEWAPVFTAEAGGDYVAVVESGRRGTDGFANFKLAKKFGQAWHVAVNEKLDRYRAKQSVFDSTSRESALEVSRDINPDTRISLSGRWRDGDVVTYAQFRRPDLLAIAHDYARLTTFKLHQTAYAIDGRTVAGRLAVVHATAEDTAVVLSYEYSSTRHTGLKFANQIFSLGFVRQY